MNLRNLNVVDMREEFKSIDKNTLERMIKIADEELKRRYGKDRLFKSTEKEVKRDQEMSQGHIRINI